MENILQIVMLINNIVQAVVSHLNKIFIVILKI